MPGVKEKKKIREAVKKAREKEEVTKEKVNKVLKKFKTGEKVEGKEEKKIRDFIMNKRLKELLKEREGKL